MDIKSIVIIVTIAAAIAIFITLLRWASNDVRKFINETIPLKREITKAEAFVVTIIIYLLIIT